MHRGLKTDPVQSNSARGRADLRPVSRATNAPLTQRVQPLLCDGRIHLLLDDVDDLRPDKAARNDVAAALKLQQLLVAEQRAALRRRRRRHRLRLRATTVCLLPPRRRGPLPLLRRLYVSPRVPQELWGAWVCSRLFASTGGSRRAGVSRLGRRHRRRPAGRLSQPRCARTCQQHRYRKLMFDALSGCSATPCGSTSFSRALPIKCGPFDCRAKTQPDGGDCVVESIPICLLRQVRRGSPGSPPFMPLAGRPAAGPCCTPTEGRC